MALQETRVWAIQQLLQKEGKLYTHRYMLKRGEKYKI